MSFVVQFSGRLSHSAIDRCWLMSSWFCAQVRLLGDEMTSFLDVAFVGVCDLLCGEETTCEEVRAAVGGVCGMQLVRPLMGVSPNESEGRGLFRRGPRRT